jgi:hypothetical protein
VTDGSDDMSEADQNESGARLMQCEVCEQWHPEDAGACRECEGDEWLWFCDACFSALRVASDERKP